MIFNCPIVLFNCLNNIDSYGTDIQINVKFINSTTEQILIYAASMLC